MITPKTTKPDANKEPNITKRSDGIYQITINRRVHGSQILRKATAKTIGEARRIRTQIIKELESLQFKAPMLTWQQATNIYSEDTRHRFTAHGHESVMLTLLKHTAAWMDFSVLNIGINEIEELIKSKIGLSRSTKDHLLKAISGTLQLLEKKGLIPRNPAREISRRSLLGKKIERKSEIMSQTEIVKLLDYLKEHHDPWYSIVGVTYHLGLRAGEVIALKWDRVDFDQNKVVIDCSYDKKLKKIGSTKNGLVRTLPMNGTLRDILQTLQRDEKLKDANDFVLPRIQDLIVGHGARTLRVLQQNAGVKQTNFHAIRAAFITHLLLANVPITKVQRMVGHADLKTTQRYIRLSGADIIGATDALDQKNEA